MTAATAPADVAGRHHAPDDLIGVRYWGKDHYSTLAYVETVMVDCGGFQIGADPRMRSNRRHYRVMIEGCRKPRRANGASADMCQVMEPRHTSYLRHGATSENHDDWCCIQDMAYAGFFTVSAEDIEPSAVLHFSDLGRAAATALREFKAAGGTFSAFELPADLAARADATMAAA